MEHLDLVPSQKAKHNHLTGMTVLTLFFSWLACQSISTFGFAEMPSGVGLSCLIDRDVHGIDSLVKKKTYENVVGLCNIAKL